MWDSSDASDFTFSSDGLLSTSHVRRWVSMAPHGALIAAGLPACAGYGYWSCGNIHVKIVHVNIYSVNFGYEAVVPTHVTLIC